MLCFCLFCKLLQILMYPSVIQIIIRNNEKIFMFCKEIINLLSKLINGEKNKEKLYATN